MASKDDERKALRQIRNIVDKLGEDSYIKTAFDGAFGLAEGNIEDDAAFSTSWYIDKVHLLQKDVPCYEKRIAEEKRINEQLAKEIDPQRDNSCSSNNNTQSGRCNNRTNRCNNKR